MLKLSAGEKKIVLARKELKEVAVSTDLTELANLFSFTGQSWGMCQDVLKNIL